MSEHLSEELGMGWQSAITHLLASKDKKVLCSTLDSKYYGPVFEPGLSLPTFEASARAQTRALLMSELKRASACAVISADPEIKVIKLQNPGFTEKPVGQEAR